MINLLFDRSSPVFRVLEAFGLVSAIFFFERKLPVIDLQVILFIFLLGFYVFTRLCNIIHWYPGEPRGIGIELHFFKTLVPTAYILAITAGVAAWGPSTLATAFLSIADFFMVVLLHVNVILIYYHLRDRDPLQINHFSRNQHL